MFKLVLSTTCQKLLRTALQDAASVAGLLIHKPIAWSADKTAKRRRAGGHARYGCMGGMGGHDVKSRGRRAFNALVLTEFKGIETHTYIYRCSMQR